MKRKNVNLIIKRFLMALLAIVIVLVSVAETKNIAFATETGSESEEFTSGNTENNEDAGSGEEASEERKEEATEERKEEATEEETEEVTEEATEEVTEEETEEVTEEAAPEEDAAAEENEEVVVPDPVEPTKPEIEGEVNNDKINQYNSEVEDYNKKVDEYNKAVDDKYEADCNKVAKENEEIEKHNQAEDEKVAQVAETNAQNQANYEAEYAQYQKDLGIAKQIADKNNGMTVEEYNNLIITNYNNPANASVEKNAAAMKFDIKKTYAVDDAEVKSGNDVTINIKHTFYTYKNYEFVVDNEYTETFVVDENDIVHLYHIAHDDDIEKTNDTPGNSLFYLNTDEDHSMGYWGPFGDVLYSNCIYKVNSWDHGTSYEISYKDGKNHYFDDTTIDFNVDYLWTPLKVYKTYNVPKEPELKVENYTPDYREKLGAPTKRSYLTYMGLMDLLAEPVIEEPVVEEPVVVPTTEEPVIVEEPIIPLAPQPAPAPAPEAPAAPAAPAAEVPYVAPAPVVIAEAPVALAEVPAPEAQVLGATREEAPTAAVLGARRGSTEDTNNSMARIIFIIIAGAAVITVLFTRRTKA